MVSRRPRSRAAKLALRPLVLCLALSPLASLHADAQLIGRFREIKFSFFGGCTNDVETTADRTSALASGTYSFDVTCRGGTARLAVSWVAPPTTPTIAALPDFGTTIPIATTVTATWTPPTSGFPPSPYRITVAAGTLSTCSDRQERTNFPGGTSTLTATKSCAFGMPSSSAQALPPGLNGGFSAGSTGESWGGASYIANVYYDFVSTTGASLGVEITGPEQTKGTTTKQAVRVFNQGPAAATATTLTVEIDKDAVVLVDGCAVVGFPYLPQKAQCDVGTLDSGAERSFEAAIHVERDGGGTFALTAAASSSTSDPDPRNNRVTKHVELLADCSQFSACLFIAVACEETTAQVRHALGGVSLLASVAVDLVPLYRLRNEVFSASPAGRRYTDLFYAHAREVTSRIASNTAFHDQFLSAYGLWKDHIRSLVDGKGSTAVISQAQVDALLGVLASLEASGSPELRGAIALEKAALNVPSLVGKSMDQALAQQKATAPATVTVPASASIHGNGGAFFHTDARVFNPSTTSKVTVTARFRCFTGPCPSNPTRTFDVAPREMKVLDDVVASLFAAPETAGPIEFDGAVVETRTYTPSRTQPTTGSVIPGFTSDAAYAEAVLMSLSHSADGGRGFRTNAGAYNPNDVGTTATFTLYSAAGARLGSTTVSVGPRAAVQVANVFGAAGVIGDVADAYAIVKADGVLPLFAYATVIDNQSQDPTYVAGRNARGAADQTLTVPAAASIHGVPPAFFHSDARIFNPSATETATVGARFRCFTGPCPSDPVRSFTVAPREMKVFDDVLVSLFGSPETAGPIELFGPVHVETRVYTPTRPDPTAGTGTPGLPSSTAAAASVLLALSHSASTAVGFRTNVGVFNPEAVDRSCTVSLYRPDGTKLADLVRAVPAGTAVQISGVFGAAGIAGDVPDAYAIVTSADGRPLFSYATVIDNRTGDSVFLAGRALN